MHLYLNHARPRDIIASLTLPKQDRFRVYALGATQIPKYQVCSVHYYCWWLVGSLLPTLSHGSRRAPRPPTNRHTHTSLTHLCSYTTGIRRVGTLRLLLSCESRLRSAPLLALRATTSMILQRHDKSCPARKQTAKPPAPRHQQNANPNSPPSPQLGVYLMLSREWWRSKFSLWPRL
jgi:hypothetical protein